MELSRRLAVKEESQSITEFTLMVALVILAFWVAIEATGIKDTISHLWTQVGTELLTAPALTKG